MKATLVFELPEEQDEFTLANRGKDLYGILWEFDQWLRSEIKYNNKDYQNVRDKLYEIMNREFFSFDEVQ